MYKCILTAPSLLEDRLQAVENYKKMLIFYHALYKTNRFHITLCLFSDISHRTSKNGISVTHLAAPHVLL